MEAIVDWHGKLRSTEGDLFVVLVCFVGCGLVVRFCGDLVVCFVSVLS